MDKDDFLEDDVNSVPSSARSSSIGSLLETPNEPLSPNALPPNEAGNRENEMGAMKKTGSKKRQHRLLSRRGLFQAAHKLDNHIKKNLKEAKEKLRGKSQKNDGQEDGAMEIGGRYGRFKSMTRIGKEGEPFVEAPKLEREIKVKTKYDSGFRLKCKNFLDHPLTEVFMLLMTVVALFITDSNQILGTKEDDLIVQYFCLFIMLVFLAELIMLSYCKEKYFLKDTYFWLDFLACVSLIGDIPTTVVELVIPSGMVAAKAGRAGRAARVGTRAGRIVRLIRLTRLMRLTKLIRIGRIYAAISDEVTMSERQTVDARKGSKGGKEMSLGRRYSSMENLNLRLKTAKQEQGKNTVAAAMVEMTISKVIVGVLLMLFVMSMIENVEGDSSAIVALKQLHLVSSMLNTTSFTKLVNDYLVNQKHCFYLRVNDTVYLDTWEEFKGQRSAEIEFLFLPNMPGEDEKFAPGEWTEGTVEAWYDVKKKEDGQANTNIMTTGFVITLLLGWMLVFHKHSKRFAAKIAVPLQVIGSDMKRVSQLIFRDEQPMSSNTLEIQKIQDAFFQMKNAIHSFAKYVPKEIVLNMTLHRKMAKLGVIPRHITIFFSDIAGFTTICESLQPNEILKMLSEYFTAMSSIIVETEGILLEFIGDAILAIWNAPYDVNDHAIACISATLQMQKKLKELKSSWEKAGYPPIAIRCGIHTDSVFVGNLGAPERMKYGVMGDGVNLASRLEELNKRYGTQQLISDKTYSCPRVTKVFILRHVDKVVVKGRSKATDLYEVCGFFHEKLEDWRDEFNKAYADAMKLYFNQEFTDASDKFEDAKNFKPDKTDLSCDLLRSRCWNYLENPPGEDWDGSSVLTSK